MRNKFNVKKTNRRKKRWPVICGNRLCSHIASEIIESVAPPLAQGPSKLTLKTLRTRKTLSPPSAQKHSCRLSGKVIETKRGVKVIPPNGKIVNVKPVK